MDAEFEGRSDRAGQKSLATEGFGKTRIAEPIPAATGVGEQAETNDYPSAYVELFSKKTGKSIGIYLVSQRFEDQHHRIIDQEVNVDGRTYDLALRSSESTILSRLRLKISRCPTTWALAPQKTTNRSCYSKIPSITFERKSRFG